MEDHASALTLTQISELIAGQVICGDDRMEECVSSACGCDLMSDVLAFTNPGSVLLTGLTNAQVIRTAEMLDLKAVVFVRDKQPDDATIEMAKSLRLVVMLSPYPLYEACGRLFAAGLQGCLNVRGNEATRT